MMEVIERIVISKKTFNMLQTDKEWRANLGQQLIEAVVTSYEKHINILGTEIESNKYLLELGIKETH